MPDFKDDHLMICRAVVLPGDDVVVPYIQTDRTLYYRVRFPNSPDWSITHSIDKRLYGLKVLSHILNYSCREIIMYSMCLGKS